MQKSEKLTHFLNPYGDLTTLHTTVRRMIEYGVTAEEIEQAISENIEEKIREIQARRPEPPMQDIPSTRKSPVCPKCGSPVRVYAVNVSKCTNVGGYWNSIAECAKCDFNELSIKSVNEYIKELQNG